MLPERFRVFLYKNIYKEKNIKTKSKSKISYESLRSIIWDSFVLEYGFGNILVEIT